MRPALRDARNRVGELAPSALAWSVWALMTAAAFLLVRRYGSNVPYMDDWEMVPALTGNQRVGPSFLWSQHNEHRIPIPKLVFLAVGWLTDGDSRAGMCFSVAALSVLAGASLLATRRIRGSTRWTDVFFPLAILSLGQHENLLWNFQIQLVLAAVFSCGALLVLTAGCTHPVATAGEFGSGAAIGVASLLLCALLSGATGVVLASPMIVWLLIVGWVRARSEDPAERRDGRAIEVAGGIVAAVALIYFVGYSRAAGSPDPEVLPIVLETTLVVLNMSLGWRAQSWHPFAAYGIVALITASAVMLTALSIRRPVERERASGLLAFLTGASMLAVAIGWGRSGFGPPTCFASRYTTVALPLVCCLYLAWELPRTPFLGRGIQILLCLLFALLAIPNARLAAKYASHDRDAMARFERGVREGLTTEDLASIEGTSLYIDRALLIERLEMLRRAEMGPFKNEPGKGR